MAPSSALLPPHFAMGLSSPTSVSEKRATCSSGGGLADAVAETNANASTPAAARTRGARADVFRCVLGLSALTARRHSIATKSKDATSIDEATL